LSAGGVIAQEGDLAIRRMRDDPPDYDRMLRWRNQPHVAEWWDTDDEPSPVTLDRIVEHYGPLTDDESMTTSCVIELAGLPIGYMHFYAWGAYPEEVRAMGLEVDAGAFGIDVFIGEPDLMPATPRWSRRPWDAPGRCER